MSVSAGSRAFLHCTIDNAQRKTVRQSCRNLCVLMRTAAYDCDVWCAVQVSWVRLRNMSNPGLLAVGQFVFSSDSRIGVNISPATRQWSLSIMVSPHISISTIREGVKVENKKKV